MSERSQPDRNLALELVRVTEFAAVAASRYMGRGDKEAADEAVQKMLDGAVRCLLAKGPDAMDLIPVRPLQELEPTVTSAFETKLTGTFEKLTG